MSCETYEYVHEKVKSKNNCPEILSHSYFCVVRSSVVGRETRTEPITDLIVIFV